jgi:hypothetical protein
MIKRDVRLNFAEFLRMKGIPGLTVIDSEVERMLVKYQKYSKVFLSIDCELNMFQMINQLPDPGKFLKFTPAQRIVFGNGLYKTITPSQRTVLLNAMFAQIDLLLNKYPNLTLAPIYQLPVDIPVAINTPTTYSQIRAKYPTRSLNLDDLYSQTSNFGSEDPSHSLSDKGFITLKTIIKSTN